MGAPVIDSVSPSTLQLARGESAEVTVAASDPEAFSGSVVFAVTRSDGTSVPAEVSLSVGGISTMLVLAVDALPGVTVEPVSFDRDGAGATGVFRITAPQ